MLRCPPWSQATGRWAPLSRGSVGRQEMVRRSRNIGGERKYRTEKVETRVDLGVVDGFGSMDEWSARPLVSRRHINPDHDPQSKAHVRVCNVL